jgi:hypothetical protein
MLMLGEVSSGLLRNSTSVPRDVATDILRLRPGEPVRWSMRPIAYAASPDLLTGVDCRLATRSDSAVRGIGTVTSHAVLTGGRVLQGSAHTVLDRSATDRRLPWSHYLSRPGVVELVGRVADADLATGFAAPVHAPGCLDLASVARRTMNSVQDSPGLDGRPPLRTARTRLRWVAIPGEVADLEVSLSIDREELRTLVVRVPGAPELGTVVALCEDIALHDWLLTALLEQIERSQIGTGTPVQVFRRLKPAIDELLHLWMPAARVDPSLERVWDSLERRPGFSRQWRASVDRVRDQLTVGGIALLSGLNPMGLRA